MRSTFRVLFYLKKGAPLKNGMLPIMVRITIDGEKVEFSTKLEIEEKKWDIKSAKAAGRTPAAGKSSVSCPLKPSDSAPLKHSTMPP
ncbi:Arm DNA-binding domain-containing protein [Bacteroides uniformis]|nr:Arm DNA-binding domain-containing protein [Bacteroides uniformis]